VDPETVEELGTVFKEGLVSRLAVQDDLLIEDVLSFGVLFHCFWVKKELIVFLILIVGCIKGAKNTKKDT